MNRSTSNPELPRRRGLGHHQDSNDCADVIHLGEWYSPLARMLAAVKRLVILPCEVHEGEKGTTICALPQNAGQRDSAILSGGDIYELVVAVFAELEMPAPIDVCETLLVKDGCFIGHKFQCEGGHALWGTGWSAVEFYDARGKLLKMVSVAASNAKRAA